MCRTCRSIRRISGRTYESIIRVNSQSGKGGVAYLLERDYQLVLPRRLQIEFSRVVQEAADTSGKELTSQELWELFEAEYLAATGPIGYRSHQLSTSGDGADRERITLHVQDDGTSPRPPRQRHGPHRRGSPRAGSANRRRGLSRTRLRLRKRRGRDRLRRDLNGSRSTSCSEWAATPTSSRPRCWRCCRASTAHSAQAGPAPPSAGCTRARKRDSQRSSLLLDCASVIGSCRATIRWAACRPWC